MHRGDGERIGAVGGGGFGEARQRREIADAAVAVLPQSVKLHGQAPEFPALSCIFQRVGARRRDRDDGEGVVEFQRW